MTTIGYATLQIIPSLEGVSKSIDGQLGGSLKAAGRRGGKDFSQGFAATTESELKKVGDSYEKLADRQKDAAGKLKTELAKLADLQAKGVADSRVVAQSERVEKARRDEARAVKQATDSYKDYEQAKKRAAEGADIKPPSGGLFKGLSSGAKSSGTEAAGGFVEGFGGPIAAIGTKAGPVGLALAATAGLALVAGGVIAQQVLAGMDQLQEQANVAAKLGLSADQIKPIAAASAKAYADNFGESVEANLDTARAAIQSGLLDPSASQADVAKVVEQLNTVSSVLGEDIPETARAAAQAVKTGIATDATGAFDLLTKASQNGLNVSGDLLDTVTEYGTQFRKVGLDGATAFGLVQQAVKAGARDTDVAADAIKEFSIRSIDGSKSSADAYAAAGLDAQKYTEAIAGGGPAATKAFGEVLTAIRAVKDPAQQSAIATGLFGTQAEDLGGALQALDLGTAAQGFGDVAGAAQRAADTVGGTAAGSFETARRQIEVAVDGMQQRLATAVGPALKSLADQFAEHGPQILAFFADLASAVTTGIAIVLRNLGLFTEELGQMVGGIGNVVGVTLQAAEAFANLTGDDERAQYFHDAAQDAFGWGEGLQTAGQGLRAAADGLDTVSDGLDKASQEAATAAANTELLKTGITTLPDGKTVVINDTTPENIQHVKDLGYAVTTLPDGHLSIRVDYKDSNDQVISPDQLGVSQRQQSAAQGNENVPKRAGGGPVFGAGSATSDSILAMLSNGEFVVNAAAARKNLPLLEIINSGKLPGFAEGGSVDRAKQFASSMDPAKYLMGGFSTSAIDCSGFVSAVANVATGRSPFESRMSTVTEGAWLKSLGFTSGSGAAGDLRIGWWDKGGGANGHTAGTFPDGTNFESNGSEGVVIGGKTGANSGQFTQHAFLQGGGSSPFAGGSAAAAVSGDGAGEPQIPGNGTSSAPASGGGGGSLPASFSGLSSFGLNSLGSGVGTTKSGSDLSAFGSAAGEAVSGQVSSALGVFGVNDAPGWLKAATQLVGGLKVGGHDPSGVSDGSLFNGSNPLGGFGQGGGSSAAPLAASPSGAGTAPPDDAGNVHGTRAGQAPGTTYIINARDTEDSFVRANRVERERAAAKLSRF